MTNNKQSSIDWFLDELIKEGYIKKLPVTQLQQAKEMEKEQRISDFRAGIECESDHHGYMWTDKDYPEQWYKDLQGGNND